MGTRDIINKTVFYTKGHKCIPNGVGDFTFVCPTKGKQQGFIPIMLRRLIRRCRQCGKKVELMEVSNGN